VAWILNASDRNWNVSNGILGMLTVEERFRHLRCSFQLHLDHSAKDNPICRLIQSSRCLFCLKTNPLYSEFKAQSELPSTHAELKLAMTTFLTSRRSAILAKSTSVLVNYISKSSRTTGLLDKVFLSPTRCQRMFLSWRQGVCFHTYVCLCGSKWTRRHVQCMGSVLARTTYEEGFEQSKGNFSKNYCDLDYLLNVGEWDLAYETLMGWWKRLAKVES
jgi:hypothetical protein